jgi:hypothetical protein
MPKIRQRGDPIVELAANAPRLVVEAKGATNPENQLVPERGILAMPDETIDLVCEAIREAPGIAAIVLGGSRARGTAGSTSDYDIGIYYEPTSPLDVGALRAIVGSLIDDPDAGTVTGIGDWGPWINGGGWLSVKGRKVDLLYRDLARVRATIADCLVGNVSINYQPGHPHGFLSAIWMGEMALCVPLVDRGACIAKLKAQVWPYPMPLKKALIGRFLWEARFSVANAEIAVVRREQTHIAGCAYRALACIGQVLFALNDRYLINEKGALPEAAGLPMTISGLAEIPSRIWVSIGESEYGATIRVLWDLVRATEAIVEREA